MKKITLLIVITILLVGCASATYKKASLGFSGGREGYLEREINPGTYVLEYSQIGGYNYDLDLNKKYWKQRASELCPNGYDGDYEVIHPAFAKIEEFECPQRFCTEYPLVSGVISCIENTDI